LSDICVELILKIVIDVIHSLFKFQGVTHNIENEGEDNISDFIVEARVLVDRVSLVFITKKLTIDGDGREVSSDSTSEIEDGSFP